MRRIRSILFAALLTLLALAPRAGAEPRFPSPQFRSGYGLPQTQAPAGAWGGRAYVDVGLLAAALVLAAWLVHTRRSRRAVFALSIACVAYFGFYRKGCVCPVGSIQNVSAALGGAALPWTVAALFALPLGMAVFRGRVFCAGVCPLGAAQDLVLWKAVEVPAWLESALGLFAHAYLALGVVYAWAGLDYVICRYDPFVGFFRLSGPGWILLSGGILLGLSMFVGRPYCRFLCPYSVLLRAAARLSSRRVTITPSECVDCRLCESACPFGAVRHPTPKSRESEVSAGRGLLIAMVAAWPVLTAAFAFGTYRAAVAQYPAEAPVPRAIEAAKLSRTADVGPMVEAARAARGRMRVGLPIAGGWVGAMVGLRLVGLATRRRRTGYTADAAACVACARCFESCPVERSTGHGESAVRAAGREAVAV